MRQIGAATRLEIHHGEGHFAHHVDEAHRRVELDAVENHELAVDARDIVEMQIAVALAHEALRAAMRERAAARGVLSFGPGPKLPELGALRVGGQQRAELRKAFLREAQDFVGCAERAVGGATSIVPWKPATLAASASISAAPSWPRSSSRLASASCGNSRILTAYSIAGPAPPMTASVDPCRRSDTTSR